MGRSIFLKTAKKNGISWDVSAAQPSLEDRVRVADSDLCGMQANVQELEGMKGRLEEELASLQDSNLKYPSYYTQPFHAYDQGNLCWQAALEVESASQV